MYHAKREYAGAGPRAENLDHPGSRGTHVQERALRPGHQFQPDNEGSSERADGPGAARGRADR